MNLIADMNVNYKDHTVIYFYVNSIVLCDRLFYIVVSMSDCHPRGPRFDSQLYPRNFSGSIGSETGSMQPREDNWVATWNKKLQIWLTKLELRLRDKCFANHKAPCTAMLQQPLHSVLALWGCSATILYFFVVLCIQTYVYSLNDKEHPFLCQSWEALLIHQYTFNVF